MRLLAPICALVLLDQWSKHWIQGRLLYGEHIEVWPGLLDIRHVRNTGAAWGMMAGWRLLLIFLALFMLALIVHRRHELFAGWRGGGTALALLAAGIAGNLIDRVRLGYVVDFLDFYHQTWHFPAFNIADSAICAGIGIYLLQQLRPPARPAATEPE